MGGGQGGGVVLLDLPANVSRAPEGFGGAGALREELGSHAVEAAGVRGGAGGRMGARRGLLSGDGFAEEDGLALRGVAGDDCLVLDPAGDGLSGSVIGKDGLVFGADGFDVGIGVNAQPVAGVLKDGHFATGSDGADLVRLGAAVDIDGGGADDGGIGRMGVGVGFAVEREGGEGKEAEQGGEEVDAHEGGAPLSILGDQPYAGGGPCRSGDLVVVMAGSCGPPDGQGGGWARPRMLWRGALSCNNSA